MKQKHAELMAQYAQDAMESVRIFRGNKVKHKHADLMLQYAKDAMETDRPWELWEYRHSPAWVWKDLTSNGPSWYIECEYRRKTEFININGFKVPEPVRKPLNCNDGYYVPSINKGESSVLIMWNDDNVDNDFLRGGLVHLTEEAATLHAKALLSFTTKED